MNNALLLLLRAHSATADVAWFDECSRFLEELYKKPQKKRDLMGAVVEDDGETVTGWFNPNTRNKRLCMLHTPTDFARMEREPESDEVLAQADAFMALGSKEKVDAIEGWLDALESKGEAADAELT